MLAAGSDDLVDVEARLQAIQQVRPTENFEPLAASFKRIQNILQQAQFTGSGACRRGAARSRARSGTFTVNFCARATWYHPSPARNYTAALEAIASLRPKVDLFFDKVLVNAPDERVRQNRLTLLNSLLTEFSTIADFSEIVDHALSLEGEIQL